MPIKPLTIHAALRDATRAAHQAVDGSFPEGMDSLATLQRYFNGMARFVAWIETQCTAPTAELPPSFQAFITDVDALATASNFALDASANSSIMATNSSEVSGPALVGALYVLMGSSMGARGLQKQARALAGRDPHPAFAFLGTLAGMDAQWHTFCRALDAMPDATLPDLTFGANRAFEIAYQAFNDVPNSKNEP